MIHDEQSHQDHFDAHLATGDIHTTYARTGYLGFVRRTEMTQSDGGRYLSTYQLTNIHFIDFLAFILHRTPRCHICCWSIRGDDNAERHEVPSYGY